MKTILFLTSIGLLSGFIGALCGVGGGIIMVPTFVLGLGMDQKKAVATSMAAIVITGLVATLNHSRTPGSIDWRVVVMVAAGSAVASWWGTDMMKQLSNPVLTRVFAALLILVGIRMLWK
jgi:uncharacterized membrane protein YfcA